MKKVISIFLGIFIFAIPFFCYASPEWAEDFSTPSILPVSSENPTFNVEFSNGNIYKYSSDSSPVYAVSWATSDSGLPSRMLFFSEDPNVHVYQLDNNNNLTTYYLTGQHNGFYYSVTLGTSQTIDNLPLLVADNAYDAIDFINDSVFKTTFDLTYITNGAVSWLSAVVNGVLQAPLLLFLILFSFVGIAVGLLFRFKRG